MEHGLPPDQFGIKISEVGPWQYGAKKWQYAYIPSLTEQCNFCASRTNKGKLPSCVQHCQANCIQLKDVDEAVRSLAEKEKQLFMTVR
jgi:Fe-S-cluster-containing dehydrogenase component